MFEGKGIAKLINEKGDILEIKRIELTFIGE